MRLNNRTHSQVKCAHCSQDNRDSRAYTWRSGVLLAMEFHRLAMRPERANAAVADTYQAASARSSSFRASYSNRVNDRYYCPGQYTSEALDLSKKIYLIVHRRFITALAMRQCSPGHQNKPLIGEAANRHGLPSRYSCAGGRSGHLCESPIGFLSFYRGDR